MTLLLADPEPAAPPEPAAAPPELAKWGGTPVLMVQVWAPRSRVSADTAEPTRQAAPSAWRAQAAPAAALPAAPFARAATPAPEPAQKLGLRLRDLDPMPDLNLWVVRELFGPERRQRSGGLKRALSSAVAALVVLDVGALAIRAAEAKPSTRTALQTLGPTPPALPTTGPELESTTTQVPASTTTSAVVRNAPAIKTVTKPSTVVQRVSSSGIPAGVPGSPAMWQCIIQHESGGNPRAVNASSGAGGLFQFLPSSWRLYGGSGLPENASVSEQWRIATNAYNRSGFSPWRGDGCV